MRAIAVEDALRTMNNARMTHEERKRVGGKLRALRVERGLTQEALATDRKVRIAIGTLQSIESGARETRESKIEKVARFFGTSLSVLRAHGSITPSDPRLDKLRDEDLAVARAFHDASTGLRLRVRKLLNEGEPDRATLLAERLALLPDEILIGFEDLLRAEESKRVALSKEDQPDRRNARRP